MATHWTEYPERIETFADLLSVLDTLDRHETESVFTAEDFENECGRTTAYTVEFHNQQPQFRPRFDQIPGLERLLEHFDIDGYPALTHRQARELRRRAAKALNRDAASLNAMTFTQIADALASGPVGTPPSGPERSDPISQPVGIQTFGEFLANVRSVEDAAGSLRRTADSMNDEPGSGYWRIQAGVYEATAEYKNHPSFPHLEAHVNSKYGPFNYANLLRVRGEVCASRHCGSTEADQLTVEEVTTVLNCPGAPTVNQPNAKRVHTRPDAVEPPGPFVEAAMRALPSVLNNAPQPQGVFDPAGRRGANYAILRQRLEAASHTRDAAEWAIHRHVEAGHLEAAPGLTSPPGVLNGGEWAMRPVTNHTYDRERCVLWANPALWDWWRSAEGASTVTKTEFPVAPAQENAAPSAPDGYTMRDIRDLLRYQRDLERFEEWRVRTYKPVVSVEESLNRTYAMALNTPQPGRLTAERAAELPVYRRLVKASHDTFGRALDEPGLLYFVGEVAEARGGTVEEMWALSTGDFRQLMDARPGASGQPGTGDAQGNGPGKGDSPKRNETDRNGGGRPKLGEGPNATVEDKALRNVYELIRAVAGPGLGPKKLLNKFRSNKDFREQVSRAGEAFDEPLFRAALAWIKDNFDQETQSENVS